MAVSLDHRPGEGRLLGLGLFVIAANKILDDETLYPVEETTGPGKTVGSRPGPEIGVWQARDPEFGTPGSGPVPSWPQSCRSFRGSPAPKITIISSSTQISWTSLPLNCNLSWAQSFNLELNRKCRGAAPPRAGGNPFSEGEAVRRTQSAIMIGSPSRGWRRWTGRPQSFEPRAGHPGQNFVREPRKEPERMPLSQYVTAANARVLPGRVTTQYTASEVRPP